MEERATRSDKDLAAHQMVSPGGQQRQKTWDECGIEEKVERLRRVMQDLGLVAQRAERVAGTAHERVIHHRHDAIGLPMMPLDNSRIAGEGDVERPPRMTRFLE